MTTRSNAVWKACGLSALLLCALSTARARAQEVLDEEPATTLSEGPPSGAAAAAPAPNPEEADKRARELFQRGRTAYEEGRYRDAWDDFRNAYMLSKRPALLYNVGQAADRLRMDREALEAFKLYLKRNPDADNRREVENRVRALEERQQQTLAEGGGTAGTSTGSESDSTLGGSGQSETEIFGDAPPAPPPADTGQPARSGFYMRLSLGLGVIADAIGGGGFSASLSSTAISPHLGVGYDITQGVVIGGALFFDFALSPSVKTGDLKNDLNSATLSMLGVFIDYYLEPRQDGWHLLGALAAAAFKFSDKSATLGNTTSSGGALIVGGGYEWPLDKQWAFGVLGRIVLARVSDDPRHHTVFAPSVAATVAYY